MHLYLSVSMPTVAWSLALAVQEKRQEWIAGVKTRSNFEEAIRNTYKDTVDSSGNKSDKKDVCALFEILWRLCRVLCLCLACS